MVFLIAKSFRLTKLPTRRTFRFLILTGPRSWTIVMNAGAAQVNGSAVLLCRVEDRRGISHLTVARSHNGVSNWVVDDTPLLAPDPNLPHEAWGLQDPGSPGLMILSAG